MNALQKVASSKGYSLSDLGRARDLDGASGPLDVTDWTSTADTATIKGGMMPLGFMAGVRAALARVRTCFESLLTVYPTCTRLGAAQSHLGANRKRNERHQPDHLVVRAAGAQRSSAD